MSVVYGRVIFTQLTMEFYLISSVATNKIIVIMRRAQNYRFSSNNNNNIN